MCKERKENAEIIKKNQCNWQFLIVWKQVEG